MFSKFISWLNGIFEKKSSLKITVHHETKTPYEDVVPYVMGIKIALVVGHTVDHPGALNYLGESENSFNSFIATKVAHELNGQGIGCKVYRRDKNLSYSKQVKKVSKEIKKDGASVALCLHFNSFKESAHGCEVLISKDHAFFGSDKTLFSYTLATYVVQQLNRRMGLKKRSDDGVLSVDENHSGGKMLSALQSNKCAAVLVEPVFANLRTTESVAFFENKDKYINCLVNSCKMYLKNK